MTQVIAPYILLQGRAEPYISLAEFKFSPTASAIDYTQIVPNGDADAQNQALEELIVRASAKIDTFCMGQFGPGTLNATVNTFNGRYRIDRSGRLRIHPPFTPVLAVSEILYGTQMGQSWNVPLTAYNCWIEEDEIIFQANGATSVNNISGMGAINQILNTGNAGEYYVTFTYTNGYANSFTSALADVSATQVVVVDPTGMFPLLNMTIWDGANDEYVQVAADYDGVSTTVPLTSPLQFAHVAGTNISATPIAIKQACIHFTVAMIKQRGQGGVMLDEMGAQTMVSGKIETSAEDEIKGYDLLDSFKVKWGRT